jgi:hypothetical protein
MATTPVIPYDAKAYFYDGLVLNSDKNGDSATFSSGSATALWLSTAYTLSNVGFADIGSSSTSTGARTYVINAPAPNAVKIITQTTTSTAATTVNSGSTAVTFDGSSQNIAFDAAGDSVILVGISTSRWAVIVNSSAALS